LSVDTPIAGILDDYRHHRALSSLNLGLVDVQLYILVDTILINVLIYFAVQTVN